MPARLEILINLIGTRRGWPDFQIFHADGRCAFLEVKRPGGRLSPDQQRIADHMKRAGHRFEVVDSVEAAISVLVAWRGVGCGEGNGAMQ
jgi:hypothetical protein